LPATIFSIFLQNHFILDLLRGSSFGSIAWSNYLDLQGIIEGCRSIQG
jgi:hypothetical protein